MYAYWPVYGAKRSCGGAVIVVVFVIGDVGSVGVGDGDGIAVGYDGDDDGDGGDHGGECGDGDDGDDGGFGDYDGERGDGDYCGACSGDAKLIRQQVHLIQQ